MRPSFLFLTLGFCSNLAAGQSADVPLANWTVPTYRAESATGGLTTMADVTPGVGFVGIQPCRVADTRGNGAPIQGGIFPNSGLRTWDLTGLCGLPAGTDAISANFTVVAAGGIPAGSFLLAWPTGQAPPPTAILTYGPGQIISNAAIVPLGPGEQLNVNVSGSTHIVMDVNGYFTDQYNPGVSFHAVSSNVAPAILAENTSTVANATAISAVITSTTPGDFATAVFARNNGNGYGVHASCQTGFGLIAGGGAGGVWAVTDGQNQAAAVYGNTIGGFGSYNWGVLGDSRGQAAGSAGVRGRVLYTDDSVLASGSLGRSGGSPPTNYGVWSDGNFGGTGAKYFVEPHPEKADMVIRYVSLEGNESGTYFRGRAKFQDGVATIDVPEDFRFVTDRDGLSIQVTPIGQMATVAVESIGLDRIVVRGSRNVEFFYTVNGVRKTHKNLTPIGPGTEFVPASPDTKMPLYLTEGQKQMLISNGTYKPDGTVNMETARRLGWDKEWEKRGRPAPQPTSN